MVQDPGDADYDSMPRGAISVTERPVIVPAKALAEQVTRLAAGKDDSEVAGTPEPGGELADEISGSIENGTRIRSYSGLTCPECGGLLYTGHSDRAESYDCLVGHRWSPQSLAEGHSAAVERSLWLAVRSLEERGRLNTQMAGRARERGHALSACQFDEAAADARRSADILRAATTGMTAQVPAEPGGA